MSSKFIPIKRDEVLSQFFLTSSGIHINNEIVFKKLLGDYARSFDSQALIDLEENFVNDSVSKDFEGNYMFVPLREFGDNGKIVGYFKLYWDNFIETIKYFKISYFENKLYGDKGSTLTDVEKGVIDVFLKDLFGFSVFSSKVRYILINYPDKISISAPKNLLPYYFMLFKHNEVVAKKENGKLVEVVPGLFKTMENNLASEDFTSKTTAMETQKLSSSEKK